MQTHFADKRSGFSRRARGALALLTLLVASCAAPVLPRKAEAERLAGARIVALRFGLPENVSFGFQDFNLLFGRTRGFFSAQPARWGATATLSADLTRALAVPGRQVQAVPGPDMPALPPVEREPREAALARLSREIGAEMARRGIDADIILIIAPLGLDPLGRHASPATTLITRGIGGMAADNYLGFRTGYVLNPAGLISPGGNLNCVSGYNLAVTDARSHAVLFASGDRLMRAAVPEDVPALTYQALSRAQQERVGEACVGALRTMLLEDLVTAGLTTHATPQPRSQP